MYTNVHRVAAGLLQNGQEFKPSVRASVPEAVSDGGPILVCFCPTAVLSNPTRPELDISRVLKNSKYVVSPSAPLQTALVRTNKFPGGPTGIGLRFSVY